MFPKHYAELLVILGAFLAGRVASAPDAKPLCNPRKNALLKEGSKSDRIDARKLTELLRQGALSAVYHGEHGLRMLKELSRRRRRAAKPLC